MGARVHYLFFHDPRYVLMYLLDRIKRFLGFDTLFVGPFQTQVLLAMWTFRHLLILPLKGYIANFNLLAERKHLTLCISGERQNNDHGRDANARVRCTPLLGAPSAVTPLPLCVGGGDELFEDVRVYIAEPAYVQAALAHLVLPEIAEQLVAACELRR